MLLVQKVHVRFDFCLRYFNLFIPPKVNIETMNLDEINRLIKELPESNPRGDKWYLENRLDQLSWKLEKTLYHKNRITLIYNNLDNNLQTIKTRMYSRI